MKPGPHVIVDSGTTLNLFPPGELQPTPRCHGEPERLANAAWHARPDVADAINGQFTPPAQYDADSDCYTTACNAVPPKLGVQIGGQMLWTDATNMILTELKDQKGLCCTGITMTKEEPYILGDTFMQGLVVVFDVGPSKTVSFAKRT